MAMIQRRPNTGVNRCRTSLRLEMSFDVESYLRGDLKPVAIKDVSPGGCKVETSIALDLGSVHQLRFTTKSGRAVTLIARSVNCEQPIFGPANRWQVGMIFAHADNPAVRSQIVALLGEC